MVILDTGISGPAREVYSEDADGEMGAHYPWITNAVPQQLSYTDQKLLLGSG